MLDAILHVGGIDCGETCTANIASGQSVTLIAKPELGYQLGSWSGGGCTGSTSTSCVVTMNSNVTVLATFSAISNVVLRQGNVFSSSQQTAQSFLRFYNAGTAAGSVTVTLSDFTTGQVFAEWTSPSIPPGAAPQFGISAPEAAATNGVTKPEKYSVTVQAQFPGTFQHVLWRPSDGTLTNLSTCASGVSAIPTRLTNVHASTIGDAGYPSSIGIFNTGTTSKSASLTISDARDGRQLGTFTTGSMPPNSSTFLSVATIETDAGIKLTAGMAHYVVTLDSEFTGYMQHLVNNISTGVITDMSTVCTFALQSRF